jgi:FtsZ-binding cell division protein ZapB
MLKEAQAKRTQITKECSHLSKTIEALESENKELKHLVRDE